jgi:hypothetical protein
MANTAKHFDAWQLALTGTSVEIDWCDEKRKQWLIT